MTPFLKEDAAGHGGVILRAKAVRDCPIELRTLRASVIGRDMSKGPDSGFTEH